MLQMYDLNGNRRIVSISVINYTPWLAMISDIATFKGLTRHISSWNDTTHERTTSSLLSFTAKVQNEQPLGITWR